MNAPASPWAFWKAALNQPALVGTDALPVHDDSPEVGYYRMRRGRGTLWEPVCIFAHGAELMARIGPWKGGDTKPAIDVWKSCCRNPVSKEVYFSVAQDGKPFPDSIKSLIKAGPDAPADAAVGHNSASADPMVILQERLDEFLAEAMKDVEKLGEPTLEKWAKSDADRIANRATALKELEREIERDKDTECRPLFEAHKRAVARWKPMEDRAKAGREKLLRSVQTYARLAQARANEEAAKKRQEELARIQAERERMSKESADLLPPPPEAALPKPEKVMIGTAGNRVGVRTVKRHVIEDMRAFAGFILAMQERPREFDELMQKLANRMRNAGITLPGVKTVEE